MSNYPLVDAASEVIVRAVQLDREHKLTESLVCYQEGIGLFLKAMKLLPESKHAFDLKERLKEKLEEYMSRAEAIKTSIKNETMTGNYHEQIVVAEGATGHGYQRVFGRFLQEGNVSQVWVEDPYIRSRYQIENFSHFCEVLVRSESQIKHIHLTTGVDHRNAKEQHTMLTQLKDDLAQRNITLHWIFSDTLHDREVRFDNGWIIKIGRGLDYVRRPVHKFCGLGVHDYDFRLCAATTIDIFHRANLRVS